MDVMNMRRLLMFPGELSTGWKIIQITASEAHTRANTIATWLTDAIPSCQYAIGVLDRDWQTPPSVDSTLTSFMWLNGQTGSVWQRYRSGAFGQLSNWSSPYDAQVADGAVFTVAYLERED